MVVKWEAAIIMYVVGERPSIVVVIRFIEREWNVGSKPQVLLHEDGYFVIRFALKKEKEAILMVGPHSFFGKPVIVKSWSADFNFQQQVHRVVPIWVRLPNLPLNCWGVGSLRRIDSLIGVPLFFDECTTHQQMISFVRILIEVDITKDLPGSVVLQDPSGNTFKQQVEYDWLPPYCSTGKIVGHVCGHGKQNTSRLMLATQVQKKVSKVWVPKNIVIPDVPKPTSVAGDETVTTVDETSDEMDTSMDIVITPTVLVHDDGWRVVSRRRRDTRSLVLNMGLTQVGFSVEEGGVVVGSPHIPP
ncbi:uncharacterized protein [Spinacia oleracea]|uniref:DUF4283 domain-containing protein n=1 Tax=Spinacia oleracea TaxID=3562 RepID=A0ABM3RQ63_SPIOL|nr:uncharacterized protein LOC130471577 [Spinacia oleracea]